MNKKPLVSILIVNWNGKDFLEDCFNTLLKISYKRIEIILVDNASTDDSVSHIGKMYPTIRIIENKKNLGFAQGNNIALKKAKGDAILLLNMDTLVEKTFLDNLVSRLYSQKDIGAVQPKILLYPQTKMIDSIGAFLLPTGALYHFGREKNSEKENYNKSMEIFSAKGACILFKKEVLKKTGLFDDDYFAYFEETDLCQRIWLAGYRVIYEPRAIIYHKGGAAANKMASSYITFHAYKNMILTYLKNFSLKYLLRIMPISLFLYECASILYLFKGNIGVSLAIQKSIAWNIVQLKKTLRKRNYVQEKIRSVEDDTFLPRLMRNVSFKYYYYQFFGGMENYSD